MWSVASYHRSLWMAEKTDYGLSGTCCNVNVISSELSIKQCSHSKIKEPDSRLEIDRVKSAFP